MHNIHFLISGLARSAATLVVACFGALGVPQADASDFGCTVLLCLANPAGPMAVAECVPPITRLYQILADFQPFPSCSLASASSGSAYARPVQNYYNACPQGTTPLASGATAVQGQSGNAYSGPYFTGVGDGNGLVPTVDAPTLPTLICVGTLLSTQQVWFGDLDTGGFVTIASYDHVVTSEAAKSGNAIDVYIDNSLWTRVHW